MSLTFYLILTDDSVVLSQDNSSIFENFCKLGKKSTTHNLLFYVIS